MCLQYLYILALRTDAASGHSHKVQCCHSPLLEQSSWVMLEEAILVG